MATKTKTTKKAAKATPKKTTAKKVVNKKTTAKKKTTRVTAVKKPKTIKSLTNGKTVGITDTILRDAHQCLLATRMRTEDMVGACKMLDKVGYWSLEAWGGATFDACVRFLKEDPWERLKTFRKAMPNTRLQMLLRGQNLVGYRHYSDDLVRKFIERSAHNGIDVFRIFDALNDTRNLKTSIEAVKDAGKIAEACISYTTSPVHSHAGFVKMAVQLEKMGADVICVKDMAGLLTPKASFDLMTKLRAKTKLPLHIHTHDSAGLSAMTYLKGIEGGANIIDTAISAISSGAAQPPTESLVAALQNTPYDTGLDLNKLADISEFFKEARKKYKKFESPYTAIDPRTLTIQVPGGMISNLANQLKEQNAEDRIDEVFEEIPKVRKDMGYPPLVTPTSQVVGTQATLNVLTGGRYSVITSETKNYFKGLYGKAPGEINARARNKAIGKETPITCRPADLLVPELENNISEVGDKAKNIEDVLTYAMFPLVATEYFDQRDSGNLQPESLDIEDDGTGSSKAAPFLAPSEFIVTVHGETYDIKVAGAGHSEDGKRPFFLKIDNRLEEIMVETVTEVLPATAGDLGSASTTPQSVRPRATKDSDVTTPVPGKVASVKISVGDTVAEGDTVLTVEAMKMENEVHAPVSGVVSSILIKVGDDVNPDETLMEIDSN